MIPPETQYTSHPDPVETPVGFLNFGEMQNWQGLLRRQHTAKTPFTWFQTQNELCFGGATEGLPCRRRDSQHWGSLQGLDDSVKLSVKSLLRDGAPKIGTSGRNQRALGLTTGTDLAAPSFSVQPLSRA